MDEIPGELFKKMDYTDDYSLASEQVSALRVRTNIENEEPGASNASLRSFPMSYASRKNTAADTHPAPAAPIHEVTTQAHLRSFGAMLEELCPISAQVEHECAAGIHQRPSPPIETDSTPSGLEVARGILRRILKRVDKATAPKKLKKPRMKSGWMWLESVLPEFEIDDATFNDLLFRETLLVSKFEEEDEKCPVPVGGLSLDIQLARGGPLSLNKDKTRSDYLCPKFLVHLSSQFDFCGHSGGSKIISWVDRDLQTLEENRKEFVETDESDFEQQSLYINSQPRFYYLRHNKKKDIFHSAYKAKNLICEGSSFILMRYLAMRRYIGTFEVSTLYINGDLCRNIYECKGPQSGMVHNKKMDVCKIYRTIIEQCGVVHKSITLMTLSGRILKHEWSKCNYILQVNPLVEIGSKPSPLEHVPLEKDFKNDLQLLSLYLDAKTVNRKRMESYMNDYPEIRQYISDYVQTILQLKPEDVFEYTAKYFLGFTPHLLPLTEYFEPPEVENGEADIRWWEHF